jgi:hypothetical protein
LPFYFLYIYSFCWHFVGSLFLYKLVKILLNLFVKVFELIIFKNK